MVVRGAVEAGDMVAATEYGNEFGLVVREVQAVQAQAGAAEGREAVVEACSDPLRLPLPDEAVLFIDSEVARPGPPVCLSKRMKGLPACEKSG